MPVEKLNETEGKIRAAAENNNPSDVVKRELETEKVIDKVAGEMTDQVMKDREAADPASPEALKRAQASAVLQSADQYIDQVLGTVVVGIGVNLTGIMPIHVATRIAYFAGVALGRAVCQGDLQQVFQARAQFREAFMAGLGSIKPVAPPPPAGKPAGIHRP